MKWLLALAAIATPGIAQAEVVSANAHGFEVRSVSMEFLFGVAFPDETHDAYERLLLDAMVGDATLFIRSDEVAEAWRIVDPILEAWTAAPEEGLASYPAGTWGPGDADQLLHREGRAWRRP